jgi:hypothetical protein
LLLLLEFAFVARTPVKSCTVLRDRFIVCSSSYDEIGGRMKKITVLLFITLLVALLAACGAEPAVVEVTRVVRETDTVEVEVTKVVETEVETVVEVTRQVEVQVPVTPEPEPIDRTGGWLDTIVSVREPSQDAAVARIAAGDLFGTGPGKRYRHTEHQCPADAFCRPDQAR